MHGSCTIYMIIKHKNLLFTDASEWITGNGSSGGSGGGGGSSGGSGGGGCGWHGALNICPRFDGPPSVGEFNKQAV